jgi:hypothetical protein
LASSVRLASHTTYDVSVKIGSFPDLPAACRLTTLFKVGSFSTDD